MKFLNLSEASEASEALYKISEGFLKEKKCIKPLCQNKSGAYVSCPQTF